MSYMPLMPTEEMIKAGVEELMDNIHGLDDEMDFNELSDVVVFVWQAMYAEHKQ